MSRKRFSPEQIIGMLREAKVTLPQGKKGRSDGKGGLPPLCGPFEKLESG